jgi:hypothetical protein
MIPTEQSSIALGANRHATHAFTMFSRSAQTRWLQKLRLFGLWLKDSITSKTASFLELLSNVIEKLTVTQLVKKRFLLYVIWSFITSHVHKNSPLDRDLSLSNPISSLTYCLFKSSFNYIISSSSRAPKVVTLPTVFRLQFCMLISSHPCVFIYVYVMRFDLSP